MLRSLRRVVRLHDASLVRHLALCVAALTAWLAREQMRVGNSVLWIFALAVVLNLQTALLSERPRFGIVARRLSPWLGLGGWTALMSLTGGARSPFIAGLSLEIILSALTTSRTGIALVTAGSVTGLWTQQAALGFDGVLLVSGLSSGFLLATGTLTAYVASRFKRSEESLFRHQAELRVRLEALEMELEEARVLGTLGRNVARLSHGLKNAVHSLRGFIGLLEPDAPGPARQSEVLTGLRTAIDHLESIARTTLDPLGFSSGNRPFDAHGTPDTVKEVVRDVGISFPAIKWSLSLEEGLPRVKVSSDELREVLTIVVRNAAEAMEGKGEVVVEAAPRGDALEIQIRDCGPGIPKDRKSRLFEPGCTTKPDGHGLGLYLARRIVETHGGVMRVGTAPGGGTLCTIDLPFLELAAS